MQGYRDMGLSYLKTISTKAKQMALNLTDMELKVEEATNNDPWGPHGTAMTEIAKAAYDIDNYKQIMGVIARRLQDKEEDWRHVYKSLLLLEFMAKHGPQKIVEELASNVGVIERLQSFQYKDAKGKDWGLNVRQRAKELSSLVTDPDRTRQERSKARANETKYTGVSSVDAKGSFGKSSTSGFGSTGGASLSQSKRYDDDFDLMAKPREEAKVEKTDFGGRSAADAVAATRARIEALKKDGPAPESPTTDAIPARTAPAPHPQKQPLGGAAVAAAAAERGPKKLSDVKVNANIAASLGGLQLAPAAKKQTATAAMGGGGGADLLGQESAGGAGAAAPAQASSHVDLLSQLEAPSPAAAPAQAAAASSPGGGDIWSNFTPSHAPTHASSGFGASDPFGSSGLSASAPAPFGSSSAAAGADLFGSTTGSASADPFGGSLEPAPAPSAAADPFSTLSGSRAPAAASGDPFAVNAAAASSKPVPDPFAVPSAGGKADAGGAAAKVGAAKAVGKALPEDMFSAPTVQAFGRPGPQTGMGPRPQGGGFGQMPGARGSPMAGGQGGFGPFGAQHPAFQQPGQGSLSQQPGQGGFGMPQQQAAFGGMPGFPAGPGPQAFGGMPDFDVSGSGGVQGFGGMQGFQSPQANASPAPTSTVASLGYSSNSAATGSGAKDPFADLGLGKL